MNDKVHQFMFVHLLCVEVGDEKTDVIALRNKDGSQKKSVNNPTVVYVFELNMVNFINNWH